MCIEISTNPSVRSWKDGDLKIKGLEGLEEASWICEIHVSTSCTSLAMTTLKKEDLFRNTGFNGDSDATFPSADS